MERISFIRSETRPFPPESILCIDRNRTRIDMNVKEFSDKQEKSLIYTVRHIIYLTKTYDEELSDEEIMKMIKEDFFGE